MNVIDTSIAEVKILEPKVFGDDRGFFYESFNQDIFRKLTGQNVSFVQDNHSRSVKGVLRGLHYQRDPFAQGKLVRCVRGEVLDVAVDIRRTSSTFGRWVAVLLSEGNKRQLWIPPGFAHGFLTLSDEAEFLYKTTQYYSPEHDACIAWNDPDIAIEWGEENPLLSAKDSAGLSLASAPLFD